MLEALKERVLQSNLKLVELGLVLFTWGNVSAIDRNSGLVAIKPSGVEYEGMRTEDIVVVNLDGVVIEGGWKPSTDLPTHLALYKAFPEVGGVVHMHSTYATAFAQAGRGIPAYGTTHADYFYGEVPCTREMTRAEIEGDYELETGNVIIETFAGKDPASIPAVIVRSHGPFAWGTNPDNAVHNAVVLEECAKMAWQNLLYNPAQRPVEAELLDKHFLRKHGKNAYYGQK